MQTFFFAGRRIAGLFVRTETGMGGGSASGDGGGMGVLGIQLVKSLRSLEIPVIFLWWIVVGVSLSAHKRNLSTWMILLLLVTVDWVR